LSSNGQPTTQSGTITLVATASGQSQATTVTASGTSIIVQDISGTMPTMTVTGTDGVSHLLQTESALTPHPAWFYPALLLASGLTPQYAASDLGQAAWNGTAVEHVALWRTNGANSSALLLQQATQHDIYLDSSSHLPVAMTFVIHPYNPNSPNTPIMPYRGMSPDRVTQIQYSDYQQVQGHPVALHIQSAMTVSPFDTTSDLVTDIQISSVNFNTGATVTAN